MSAPGRLVRPHSALRRLRALLSGKPARPAAPATTGKPLTTLQEANPRNLPEVWFNSTFPVATVPPPPGFERNRTPDDDRNVKLGKSECCSRGNGRCRVSVC